MLDLIYKALEELPERTSKVFRLHRIEGQAQKDIARELGVSPTLINLMVWKAHRHCIDYLKLHGTHAL